jgi:SAM-dependent methyltransferase
MAAVTDILRCPRCKARVESSEAGTLFCTNAECAFAQSGFPLIGNTPVLVDFERSVLSRQKVLESGARPEKPLRERKISRRIVSTFLRSEGPTLSNVQQFLAEVKKRNSEPVVLVIGGGVRGVGTDPLYEDKDITIIGTDIFRSGMTDFVADAHHLPLAEGSIDGVWIQAVLEHVLEPQCVVDEIHRVLAPQGAVYAETPFMQQVHMGPYDFTRFTPSGHRWLFRRFEEVGSGITRGPGTVMLWSIRYFVGSIFRTNKAGTLAAMMFFWLRLFDRWAKAGYAADGASGTFFLGRRSDKTLIPRDMVTYYRGAQ